MDGVQLAGEIIDSGKALAQLERFIELSAAAGGKKDAAAP
jgi:anthranilate phosphoribosyltransferase